MPCVTAKLEAAASHALCHGQAGGSGINVGDDRNLMPGFQAASAAGEPARMRVRRYDRGEDAAGDAVDGGAANHHEEFGFVTVDRTHTLRSFAAYADWVKALHFSDPPPKVGSAPSHTLYPDVPVPSRHVVSQSGPIRIWISVLLGYPQCPARRHTWSATGSCGIPAGGKLAAVVNAKRCLCVQGFGDTAPPVRKRKLCSYSGPEPSVEEIEAEFWRIVESPDEVRTPALCPNAAWPARPAHCLGRHAPHGPVPAMSAKPVWAASLPASGRKALVCSGWRMGQCLPD